MQDDFEKRIKEKFDELCKDYDGMRTVLAQIHMRSSIEEKLNERVWDYYITDCCTCDCEKNYGGNCKYPEKYKDGGCK